MTANRGKRQALGRGLGALIPPARPSSAVRETPERDGLRTIAIEQLEPNPEQPRKHFDRGALEQLAASLRTQGFIQPIVAAPIADARDRFVILAGERRWRAAQLAGIHDVPVIVRDTPHHARLELALVENLQRADLNPIEEARAFQQLLDLNEMTHDQLAERVGKDRSTVTNALRLLRLPEQVQEMVVAGDLSMGHARALLSLPSASEMVAVAHRVRSGDLSVRATEKLVRTQLAADKPAADEPPDEERDRHGIIVRDLEDRLGRRLGVRVALRTGKNPRGPGRIEIPYRGLDELNRVLHLLLEDD
ncbi:MAG: ParB/RepB/Spo0J family partition protein [Myxococcales bacterium FL481]|nr:MAG: ParB/RepB/Spo0J family partition protein [Myxococcales bacterium FL481]